MAAKQLPKYTILAPFGGESSFPTRLNQLIVRSSSWLR